MNCDFLCERYLEEKNPKYNALVKNTVVVLYHTLEKYKLYFPDFTDHTVLYSMQVLDFCNKLIGENIKQLNDDEVYILIMAAYLHDSGMGISEEDYSALYEKVVSAEYRQTHPNSSIRETIRSLHQSFSKSFILKYGNLFDIPSPAHVQAIAAISESHRKTDLFDPDILPELMQLPNGNVVHLPYLAALIRLADELDIAADRNLGIDASGFDTVFKQMHRAIRHLHILPDRFILDVADEDEALFEDIRAEIEKLDETLQYCREAAAQRTPFEITQKSVEIRRIIH